MTKLTQVAIATRKTIRWSIIVIIFLIIGKFSLDMGIRVYRHFYPEPPPPPTVTFGKLPKIAFPAKDRPKMGTISVETPTGELPVFKDQLKVYFMPKLSSQLLSLETTRFRTAALGFNEETQVSDTVYRFKSPNSSTLEINIVTGAFSISSDLSSDSSILNLRALIPELAASKVRTFLGSGSFLPADLTGPIVHEFLKAQDKNLVGAISLSEANFVKINLFRKSFEDFPSLTANPKQSNVWFIVSGSTEKGKEIVAGQYHYYPVDEEKSATYPIKTSEQALQELTNGGGFIASLGTNKEEAGITIRKIYLSYFDPEVESDYYEPIIVFEGDNGFVGYVPAVTADYYGE